MTDSRNTRHLRQAAFLFCLAIVLVRAWGRLLHAELWAEDGSIFLTEGLEFGWSSLFIPFAGSYHVLQRTIVLLALSLFPTAWLPWIVCGFCYLLFAAVVSSFVRTDYAWLFPSPAVRVLISAALCFAPGLREMFGNLANINWFLYLWLGFLALRAPTKEIGAWRMAGVFVAMFSLGTTVLLVPLFLWRTWMSHRLKAAVAFRSNLKIVALMIVTIIILVFSKDEKYAAIPVVGTARLAATFLRNFHNFFLLLPLVGDQLTVRIDGFLSPLSQVGILVLVLSFVAFRLKPVWRAPGFHAILLFVAGTVAWAPLGWIARRGAFDTFESPIGMGILNMRFSFPVPAVSLFLWVYVFQTFGRTHRALRNLAVVFLCLNIAFALHRFRINPYGPERRWDNTYESLELALKTGCPREVVRPIYPDGWALTYRSPLAADCTAIKAAEKP